jgi:5'-3' exonuclease
MSMDYNNAIVLNDGTCLLYIHGAREDYEKSIHNHLKAIMHNCKSNRYIGVLDGKKNFRKEIDTTYKANRSKANILESMPYFYKIKELLIEKYNFILVENVEADDLVSIIANTLSSKDLTLEINGEVYTRVTHNNIITTIDKDLLQLNGLLYNTKKHSLLEINDENSCIELNDKRELKGQGYKFFYAQMLMGDTADNIKGINKVGGVKTYNILKECNTREDCHNTVLNEYKKEYNEDYITEFNKSYTLLYVLREANIPQLDIQIFNE